MTVKELIEALQQLPQDRPVMVSFYDSDEGLRSISSRLLAGTQSAMS